MQTTDDILGRATFITVINIQQVPAKVDTGADSSSIWASDISEHDGVLSFVLFAPGSKFYTGERISSNTYTSMRVASSSGERQERYIVTLPMTIVGQQFHVRCTLADRSTLTYPVLLGREFLSGNFIVDVRQDIPDEANRALLHDKYRRLHAAKEHGA